MTDFMDRLLMAPNLTPHGFCLSWAPGLLTLHIVSDAMIAIAYYSIPLSLAWLVARRRDIQFGWALILFGSFIMACGTTHVIDIWTLWHADYLMQGVVKAATAAISVMTAILMWPLIPRLLELPSPTALADANRRLAEQIAEKQAALEALQREIAEREQAEAMLRHSQKMRAIGELTGGVAHDVNNLLMIVQGNLEVMQRRLPEPPKLTVYIDRAMQAIDRGALLTRQLLAFARRQPLQPSAVDVNGRVRGLSELLPRSVGNRVKLVLDLAPELWPAEADCGQLDSAMLNLALNAGHAMPDGGELVIRTANIQLGPQQALWDDLDVEEAEAGDYVLVAVSDTGIGMTPEVRDKAFEPFFTTKPVGIGHGLGLSQVYGFAKQSHGRISLHTAAGQGTTISLLLRRATVSATAALADPALEPAAAAD